MIGIIEGKVCHLSAPSACIMTTSGVGYEIELPLPAFCQLQMDETCLLWTHLHVREDAQLLYGFLNLSERDVFRQLIRINGVGAKMALAMMSTMSVSELKHCVDSDNEKALVKVPGIGKKTAQRLLIELKGKLDGIESLSISNISGEDLLATSSNDIVFTEVESALISLGYKEKEAKLALQAARDTLTDDKAFDTQTLLKISLQLLSTY